MYTRNLVNKYSNSRKTKIEKDDPLVKISDDNQYLGYLQDEYPGGDLYVYKLPELKLLFTLKNKVAGFSFINSGDTLLAALSFDSLFILNRNGKKILNKKIERNIASDPFRNFSAAINNIGYIECSNKKDTIVFHYFQKKHSFQYLNKNSNYGDPISTVNNKILLGKILTNDYLLINIETNQYDTIKVNGISPYINFCITNKNLVFYTSFSTLYSKNYSRRGELITKKRIQFPFYIEIFDLMQRKKIKSFSFEHPVVLSFADMKLDRLLLIGSEKCFYTNSDGFKIFESDNFNWDSKKPVITNDGSYFAFFDEEQSRIRVIPLDPKEIIRKVREEKVFGEIGELSSDTKKLLGIE